MVKSSTLFNDLMATATLLSFSGVISSLSEFQHQLVTTLRQFDQALRTEGENAQDVEILCRIVCRYLDECIRQLMVKNRLSWQHGSLEKPFYGDTGADLSPADGLKTLLKKQNKQVFFFALHLLPLLTVLPDFTLSRVELPAISPLSSAPLPAFATSAPLPVRHHEETGDAPRHDRGYLLLQIVLYTLLLIALWVGCFHYIGDLQ